MYFACMIFIIIIYSCNVHVAVVSLYPMFPFGLNSTYICMVDLVTCMTLASIFSHACTGVLLQIFSPLKDFSREIRV